MRQHLLLIAFAILIVGCSSNRPDVAPYEFQTFESVNAEITRPSELPDVAPLECWPSQDDCRVAGYTNPDDVKALDVFKILAEGNTEVAADNAQALAIMVEREEAILAAAKAQESITRLREEQLAWERRERQREKWYYRILLGVSIAAGLYASGN